MSYDAISLKEQLIISARRAYERGIQTGNGGNISVRVPGEELMIAKPSKVSFIECTEENLVTVDFDGNTVEGKLRPTRDALMHAAIYRELPQVGGIIHCHAPWSLAWSFTGKDLPLPALHHRSKLGNIPLLPVLPEASEEGIRAVVELLRKCPNINGFILAHHGLIAIGPDLYQAEHSAELIEETAQVVWLTEIGRHMGIVKG